MQREGVAVKRDIRRQLEESAKLKRLVADTMVGEIELAAKALIACYARGGKVVLCGNGGSAGDAQHLAGEFVGRFLRERRAVPAIALTTDTSILTAIGNDYGFDQVFSRQAEAHVNEGDVFIGISTSGNSANVLRALEVSKARRATTIGLTGNDGGELARAADIALTVPSSSTPRIQECHIVIGHILCDMAERSL
ncbi:MAG: D-sedoheptulose 7-phosphate isomerase [Candidatus Poribacteria bacterium]